MTLYNRSPSDLREIGNFLSMMATITSIGASGFYLLDAYTKRKDLTHPLIAFLLTIF